MALPDWERSLEAELSRLGDAHLLRQRRLVRPLSATHVEVDGRRLVNFAANDYLGLSHHPRVIEAMRAAAAQYGAGSGAAGLVTGHGPAHADAEASIARWKGTPAAVLLPSGYQANLAAVQTLAAVGAQAGAGGARFLVDKLAHASLIDAVRSTNRPFRIFPHNHLGKLRRLLEAADSGQLQIVVTESIFSMDGDPADLDGIARLKTVHPFVLLLDEAHGSGVYGKAGTGFAAECGAAQAVDVTVVTLSKALGVAGGAVCGGETFCRAVINFGRAFIYSTAIAPPLAAAASAAIEVLQAEPERQQRVRALARQVRRDLQQMGLEIPPGDSPIVPLILGTESAAVAAANQLQMRGFLLTAIRPPTVAKGASRLRLTLSCEHTDDEVRRLVQAVAAVIAR